MHVDLSVSVHICVLCVYVCVCVFLTVCLYVCTYVRTIMTVCHLVLVCVCPGVGESVCPCVRAFCICVASQCSLKSLARFSLQPRWPIASFDATLISVLPNAPSASSRLSCCHASRDDPHLGVHPRLPVLASAPPSSLPL